MLFFSLLRKFPKKSFSCLSRTTPMPTSSTQKRKRVSFSDETSIRVLERRSSSPDIPEHIEGEDYFEVDHIYKGKLRYGKLEYKARSKKRHEKETYAPARYFTRSPVSLIIFYAKLSHNGIDLTPPRRLKVWYDHHRANTSPGRDQDDDSPATEEEARRILRWCRKEFKKIRAGEYDEDNDDDDCSSDEEDDSHDRSSDGDGDSDHSGKDQSGSYHSEDADETQNDDDSEWQMDSEADDSDG